MRPMKSPAEARCWPDLRRGPRSRCCLLLWASLAPASSAWAGDLDVVSSGAEGVVVVLDGEVKGPTPLHLHEVAEGLHEVGFKPTRFGSIAFSQAVPVPAEGGVELAVDLVARTAEIRVAAADPAPAVAPEPPATPAAAPLPPVSTGDLYVTSDVEGASILLDGRDTGERTPAMLTGVPAGPHEVTLRSACARAMASVVVRPDLIERTQATMKVGTGTLAISTKPDGASIALDGEQLGQAPLVRRDVSCGEHELVLRAPGFLEGARKVEVPAFETTQVQLALEEERFGILVIAPSPLQARLALDGVELGFGPMTVEEVGAGPHELEVALDGYTPDHRTIEVAPDAVTRAEVALVPVSEAPVPRPPWARVGLNSVATASGLGLGAAALSSYLSARPYYRDFLDEPDDHVAQQIFDEEVNPRRKAALFEGIGAVVLLGSSAALWATTDLRVGIAPGEISFHGRL